MAKRFGIDIGGSGVKGAPVDLKRGELAKDRHRIKTPKPATPGAVLDVAAAIVERFGWSGPVGCAVPSVVQDGVVRSAANIDESWIGVRGADLLAERIGQPVTLLNDADAAGLAEVTYGAGRGRRGVVIVLTFGTGIGSAVFSDGSLLPNTELGHLEFRGMDAEHYAAARLVEKEDMRLDWWASRVNEFLHHVAGLFSPDLFVFGGGISKRFDKIATFLDVDVEIVVAELRNNAGIVGAALAADAAFG